VACEQPDLPICGSGFLSSCDTDAQCGSGICQRRRQCSAGGGGEYRMCNVRCTTDSNCDYGFTCASDGHCQPISCGAGGTCPPDYLCGTNSLCIRRSCTTDSECSVACVNGRCFDRPGRCAFAGG
jgi:hypothetical protein